LNETELHRRKIDSADLGGRLPAEGEMFQGLGLYLCRNLMEDYRPGRDYDLTLGPDGMFENITPVERTPDQETDAFPRRISGECTRYRGITAALEALAVLMEAHGNARHAEAFRSAVKDLPVAD